MAIRRCAGERCVSSGNAFAARLSLLLLRSQGTFMVRPGELGSYKKQEGCWDARSLLELSSPERIPPG